MRAKERDNHGSFLFNKRRRKKLGIFTSFSMELGKGFENLFELLELMELQAE